MRQRLEEGDEIIRDGGRKMIGGDGEVSRTRDDRN